jgi:hypothetical protein
MPLWVKIALKMALRWLLQKLKAELRNGICLRLDHHWLCLYLVDNPQNHPTSRVNLIL